jgi:hypothetical protein
MGRRAVSSASSSGGKDFNATSEVVEGEGGWKDVFQSPCFGSSDMVVVVAHSSNISCSILQKHHPEVLRFAHCVVSMIHNSPDTPKWLLLHPVT